MDELNRIIAELVREYLAGKLGYRLVDKLAVAVIVNRTDWYADHIDCTVYRIRTLKSGREKWVPLYERIILYQKAKDCLYFQDAFHVAERFLTKNHAWLKKLAGGHRKDWPSLGG